jgi:diketogulonate reductase-like aldo/keto reductase
LCKKDNIQVVAYSSLGVGGLLDHQIVLDVAKRCKRTPAQILLRWGLQKGVCVIPKASSKERIEENLKVVEFKLDVDEMDELANISHEYSTPKHFCWDPESIKF